MRKDISTLLDDLDCIYIPPPFLAQIAVKQSAPKIFSTPLCKTRYQKKAFFTERCLFYRLISTTKQRINGIYRKICDLTKKTTAFLVRNRGPPSEI